MSFDINNKILTSDMIGPDGQILNSNFRKITPDLVTSVYTKGGQIISQGADGNGLYTITFQYDAGGCGNPDSGFNILIDNNIPWSRVVAKFDLTGIASCWTLNRDKTITGSSVYGDLETNLNSYDPSQGDIIYTVDAVNSFNKSAIAVKDRACDNAADNFMRFGGNKIFYAFFRRLINGNASGPGFGRSCTTTGTGSRCTISEIYVI